jgi:hypothetical protein
MRNYWFPNRKGGIFCSGKIMVHPKAETEGQSRICAEAYKMYAAQARPQIDAAGAEKYHFQTGTN